MSERLFVLPMNGFLMMAMAFCIGLWRGHNLDGSVQPMAYGVWFWSASLVLTPLGAARGET